MKKHIIVFAIALSTLGLAGTAFGEEQVNYPGGAAVISPPAENAAALLLEAGEAGLEAAALRKAAKEDTLLKAFGSALERYGAMEEKLQEQKRLLERAIDAASDSRHRLHVIQAYDQVERDIAETRKVVSILRLR